MKRTLAFLLALVMVLSLCACGTEKASETTPITNTEAPATEAPATEEPAYTEVVINMENWQDYFEIRPFEEKSLNAFGEVESCTSGTYNIYLKDEFLPLLKKWGVNVSVKVSVTYELRDFDFENVQFIENEKDSIGTVRDHEEVIVMYDNRDAVNSDSYYSTGSGQVLGRSMPLFVGENNNRRAFYLTFEVNDVTGTLLLAK